MNITDIKKDCCGCAGCHDICPVNAISMEKDKDGFIIPAVNPENCINCEKCIQKCPVLNKSEQHDRIEYWYGWSRQEKVKSISSSGGFFSVFADYIIKNGGVVLAAKFSNDYYSVSYGTTENDDLDSLRRSKYVQSDASGMYSAARKYLQEGRRVLLVGTPCQVAAARRNLPSSKNLFLIDFLCGGVTPQSSFENYIKWQERKHRAKVISVNFRDKTKGWSNPHIRLRFDNGQEYYSGYEFDYYYYYYYCTPYLKNEQCMHCSFVSHADSDIIIGDFWGFRKLGLQSDDTGMSLLVANTLQGQQLINLIKDQVVLYPLEKEYTDYAFIEKKHTEDEIKTRKIFLEQVNRLGFVEAAKANKFKYGKFGILVKKALNRIKR